MIKIFIACKRYCVNGTLCVCSAYFSLGKAGGLWNIVLRAVTCMVVYSVPAGTSLTVGGPKEDLGYLLYVR